MSTDEKLNRNMNTLFYVLSVLGVILFVLSMYFWSLVIEQATLVHKAEGECIATLISQGVERIDVATENGICWKEKNGYYRNK